MIAMSSIAVHVYDCRTFCFPGHMPPETTIAGPRTFPVANHESRFLRCFFLGVADVRGGKCSVSVYDVDVSSYDYFLPFTIQIQCVELFLRAFKADIRQLNLPHGTKN